MIESEEFKDDLIHEIVKSGARSLPNVQFEDQMMLRIQKELDYKKEVSAQLKFSFQFFVMALLFGIGLVLVILLDKILGEYEIKTVVILVLFITSIIGVMNVGNYHRLINKYSV